jgi:polyphosphate kinase 2 (PPK2 family)
MGDVKERQHWKAYMTAYEDAIQRTATPEAPWSSCPPTTSGSRAW